MHSNECPVPYCISSNDKYCGTLEECENATIDTVGLSTPVIIVICAVGGAFFAYFLYSCVYKKLFKPKKETKKYSRRPVSQELRESETR